MNIKEFLEKLLKKAQTGMGQEMFPDAPVVSPTVPTLEQPQTPPTTPQPPQQGEGQFGPTIGEPEGGGIQTALVPWKQYFYLNLSNVPTGPDDAFLVNLGYKYNKRFDQWGKQVNIDNAFSIEGELDSIQAQFRVPVFRDAMEDIRKTFALDKPVVQTPEIDEIKKIKTDKEIDSKEKYKVAEEFVRNSLQKIVDNIGTPETEAFLDSLTNLNNMFYKYSYLNTMLIAMQNWEKDPETGELIRRSGRVANKDKWEKDFGRKVRDDEIARGSDVFAPMIANIKSSGIKVLLNAINSYIKAFGDGDFSTTIGRLYGFIRKKIPTGRTKKKGFISKGLYEYFNKEVQANRDKFSTLSDVYQYFSEAADAGEVGEESVEKILMGFKMGPVYDMDQTDIIPGQEHKDPMQEIERVEQLWLGTNNTDTEKTMSIRDLAVKAASSGKIVSGQNIAVGLDKRTGPAGGWSKGQEIQISDRIAGERQLFTLIHELAHSVLHFGDEKRKHTRAEAEVDAEGTAYVVMGHYGFSDNQRAYNYLANWTAKQEKAGDFIKDRFEPILEAANAIIAGIEMQKLEDYGGKAATVAMNWFKKIIVAKRNKDLLSEIRDYDEYIF